MYTIRMWMFFTRRIFFETPNGNIVCLESIFCKIQEQAGKAAEDCFHRLFRSLRTTKLCKISAKTKDFAAQTRCAQTYVAKSLTQIFYRASSLKLLQMPSENNPIRLPCRPLI